MKKCPCGSNNDYESCCGKFIDNNQAPTSPEELMRSRYTAFATDNLQYIKNTMKSPAADNFNGKSTPNIKWLKLEVLNSSIEATKGKVEFVAYYRHHDKIQTLHEKSEFRLDDGRWYYIDGALVENHSPLKINRNSPCICGSGKKYKKCCFSNC